jgi:hypothetical protein
MIFSIDKYQIGLSVNCGNGYLHFKLTSDPPFTYSNTYHPFNDLELDNINELTSTVADNEMTRELYKYILEKFRSGGDENLSIAIRFLMLFDKDSPQSTINHFNTKITNGIIDEAEEELEGFNSTYFFNKSCLTSGIKITVQARKSNYCHGKYLAYDIICSPECQSSQETHPFYRIYEEKTYEYGLNMLKSSSGIVENNNLMVAILNLIAKPDLYLKEEAKTTQTMKYRAYLIEFITWMWD